MKTDETNFPRSPAKVAHRLAVGRTAGSTAAHGKSSSEQEQDALDTWRAVQAEGRDPDDPIHVHGYDLESVSSETRNVISAFSSDLAMMRNALDAAEERLIAADKARRFDPRTGLLRRDALIAEAWHLEALDLREGAESSVAVLRVEGVSRLHETAGWARSEMAVEVLGRILSEKIAPAERAGRIHDSAFAILLTGLAGQNALARAAEIARSLVTAINTSPELSVLRPGRLYVGQTALHAREEPYDALDRALKEATDTMEGG